MTLRWRITLLTAGLIAAAVLLVGVGAYVISARIQLSSVDRALASALTDTRIRALADRPTEAPGDGDVVIGLARIDRFGRLVVMRQAGTADDPVPFPTLVPAEITDAQGGPVTVAGDPDQRVLVREVKPGGAKIVAAAPLTTLETERTRLTRGIVTSAALVAALGALAAWLFVRRAFRPMQDMVAVTGAVAAGDLSRRLDPAQAGTELGELSTAVNAMIDSLSSSINEVADAQARLRQFVSDASHEIRTPLTVIQGYAELLDAPGTERSEVEARALRRIRDESGRLERLVTQLLLLGRIEAQGDAGAEPETVDLEPIVRDGFADLAALGARPVVLDTVPAFARVDADSWRQLVANLAQNIERHTPAATSASVSLLDDGRQIRLLVDDGGPGVPADQRDRVIDRFARGQDSPGGFGLGMSIVAAVVSASGGTLALSESPEGGLRVDITVPGASTDAGDG